MKTSIPVPETFVALFDFVQQPLIELANKHGVVLHSKRSDARTGMEYARLPDMSLCPVKCLDDYLEERNELITQYRAMHLEAYGIERIVRHEIENQSATLTGDLSKVIDSLEAYNTPEPLINEIYKKAYNEAYS